MSYQQNYNAPGQFQSSGHFNPQQFPPPKKSSGPWLILGIIGGVGFLCVAVCCGGGFLFVNWGMGQVSADIENQIRDDPQIVQYIGDIESLSVDYVKSAEYDDMDTFVYNIRGTKGSGELTVTSTVNASGGEDIQSAFLTLDNGEIVYLDAGSGANPLDDPFTDPFMYE